MSWDGTLSFPLSFYSMSFRLAEVKVTSMLLGADSERGRWLGLVGQSTRRQQRPERDEQHGWLDTQTRDKTDEKRETRPLLTHRVATSCGVNTHGFAEYWFNINRNELFFYIARITENLGVFRGCQ